MTDTHKVALVGSKGMLAHMVLRGKPVTWLVHPFDLPEFDITDRERVLATLKALKPDIIINCAAYTNVDGCENDSDAAMRVNGEGPGHLAAAAKQIGATLVHISTDYVFDGNKKTPYVEEDVPNPQSVYGRTKLAGEQAIAVSGLERYFILRTSWLYGPGGKNFVETILRLATEREELRIVADQVGCPTYTGDLAQAIFSLLRLADPPHSSPVIPQDLYGIYHYANEGICSWYDFACEIVNNARALGVSTKAERIEPIRTVDFPLPAPRPAYSVFDKSKYKHTTGADIPGWQESLVAYFQNR